MLKLFKMANHLEYSYVNWLVSSKKVDTKMLADEILKRLAFTKNSFSYEISKSILENLFFVGTDLRDEYSNYYLEEYEDFRDYLYYKKLISYEVMDDIGVGFETYIYELPSGINSYNLAALIYEDEYDQDEFDLISVVNRLLMEIENEI